jgi:hypothetical protein
MTKGDKKMVTYYEIDETTARRAKEANSFNNYKEGSATDNYRAMVDSAMELAKEQKSRVDQIHHDKIDKLLNIYAKKLAQNLNHRNQIDARVPSVMIAGPANFPTRAKEKQNVARDQNMKEFQDIQGLLDKISSVGHGGISADDPAALNKLKAKLENLENEQQKMKDVNTYYRKHGTLEGAPHLSDEAISKLQSAFADTRWGQKTKPFETWMLSNNNANIKRIRERIAGLERMAEKPPSGWTFDGGEVIMNADENRLQVLFDEKPNEELRSELKRNGFRWAPSQGAWQRQLTNNALCSARRIKVIAPLDVVSKSSIKQDLTQYSELAKRTSATTPVHSRPGHDVAR